MGELSPNTRTVRHGRLYFVHDTTRKTQREATAASVRALDVTLTAYGEDLERVEVFKYLGHLMSMDDSDIQAVRSNMRKARKVWARLSRISAPSYGQCNTQDMQHVLQSNKTGGSAIWERDMESYSISNETTRGLPQKSSLEDGEGEHTST